MSTTTASAHPLTITLFAQLVERLRHNSARYDHIAQQHRLAQRPTHHARQRAHDVGLHVDITKARTVRLSKSDGCAGASAAFDQSFAFLDGTAGSVCPLWEDAEAGTETGEEGDDEESNSEDVCTPNSWPSASAEREHRIVVGSWGTRLATPSPSPLGLGPSQREQRKEFGDSDERGAADTRGYTRSRMARLSKVRRTRSK